MEEEILCEIQLSLLCEVQQVFYQVTMSEDSETNKKEYLIR